ncbi:penicillin-binding transpeptidase domain-containing protein, partial [Klebsiella pneumoniae]|nr:penicillin-binding transpeptidase domain-containing protein [Klebsiella pneumoniae]
GKHNGTAGAWINSSLQISPLEQVAFLRKVANRTLPVSANALDMTWRVTEIAARPDGWAIHGKTGTGSPGAPITHEGNYDRAHAYGWFVG